MDFRFSPEEEAFRSEFVTWLRGNLPEGWDRPGYRWWGSEDEWVAVHRDFHKRLHAAGYSGMQIPKEYGGQGRSMAEDLIVQEELASHCLAIRLPGLITFGMGVQTILYCGNEDQKKAFIPKMLDGTHIWCQGFSEPNAGSDVVNVVTRAERDGDHYVVNGQKIWTSFAHVSDYCLLLVRTDSKAAKHKGLSYLLMDMKLPGVDVRPIRQITGDAEFNEIFLEDVRLPANMLVGMEGQGWNIAITTLMFERVLGDIIMAESFGRAGEYLTAMAKDLKRSGRPAIEESAFRQDLARVLIDLKILKYHGYRNLSHVLNGGMPGPEGSIGKLLWSLHAIRSTSAALRILGPYGLLTRESSRAAQYGMWPHSFLTSKGTTIAAGTTEINKNIIAERVLGLPKDVTRQARQEGV